MLRRGTAVSVILAAVIVVTSVDSGTPCNICGFASISLYVVAVCSRYREIVK